jgi:hypothetical protein
MDEPHCEQNRAVDFTSAPQRGQYMASTLLCSENGGNCRLSFPSVSQCGEEREHDAAKQQRDEGAQRNRSMPHVSLPDKRHAFHGVTSFYVRGDRLSKRIEQA